MIEFTITFVRVFGMGLLLAAPILLVLVLLAVGLGLFAGRRQGLVWFDALYWTFVTATTVGYGDIQPRGRMTKIIAVFIAILGILFTGILVAIAVQATGVAIRSHVDIPAIESRFAE